MEFVVCDIIVGWLPLFYYQHNYGPSGNPPQPYRQHHCFFRIENGVVMKKLLCVLFISLLLGCTHRKWQGPITDDFCRTPKSLLDNLEIRAKL